MQIAKNHAGDLKARSAAFFAILISCVAIPHAHAQLEIEGADGSDLALNVTTTSNRINLAAAPTGVWNGPNTNPGRGVYDSNQWAVVFRYSSVNIPAGRTLSFSNHVSRAPVVWLVSGDVTINGVLDVSARQEEKVNDMFEPGPGGFRGGPSIIGDGSDGPGLGPGHTTTGRGAAAVYAIEGSGAKYGNARIVPLIGGSGATSFFGNFGGGGGAILIACKGTITINGQILARGAGIGSAGAVRMVANSLKGGGSVFADRSTQGRIRLEAVDSSNSGLQTYPATIVVQPDSPPTLWPSVGSPSVKLVSVSGITLPPDPKSDLGVNGGDVRFTNSSLATVLIETRNMPASAKVKVHVSPKLTSVGAVTHLAARLPGGNTNLTTWQVRTNLPSGFFTLQVHATTQ